VKDYTVSVYASSKVTITDSNGKTSDPTNPSSTVVVTPVVTTPVVVTPVVVTPVVVTPVVVTPVVVTPVVTTATVAALTSALTTAMTQVASNAYPVTYGSSYYLYQGQYTGNSAFYFVQVATANPHFYVLSTVSLTSVG
jgi:hypothetical protein